MQKTRGLKFRLDGGINMQDSAYECSGNICTTSSRPMYQRSFGKFLVFSTVQFACAKSRFVRACFLPVCIFYLITPVPPLTRNESTFVVYGRLQILIIISRLWILRQRRHWKLKLKWRKVSEIANICYIVTYICTGAC